MRPLLIASECLAGRDNRDPGSDTEADLYQLTELLYHSVYLLRAGSPQIENGFCVVEDYEYVLWG